jgi:NadR type nicotinamide-nucleotide adenylyltransferase
VTSSRPLVVVVTGSECTGKTTLAREIAERFGAPWSGEFAREYLDRKGAPLDASDVEAIARGQVEAEDAGMAAARAAGAGVVVKDTDLVSTVVYANHYYEGCPGWIEQAAGERLGDLYLLLHPDVPWVADGLQRDRPAERQQMHDLFEARLEAYGATVVDITGDWPIRRAKAIEAIEAIEAIDRSLSHKGSDSFR